MHCNNNKAKREINCTLFIMSKCKQETLEITLNDGSRFNISNTGL